MPEHLTLFRQDADIEIRDGVLLGRDLLARTSGSSPPLAPGLEV